jgi:hypothetical protein
MSEVMTSERVSVLDTDLNVSYVNGDFMKIYHTVAQGVEESGEASSGGRMQEAPKWAASLIFK